MSDGCIECARFGVPGFVIITLPDDREENPYPYPVDVTRPCLTCNAGREYARRAGRTQDKAAEDGYPDGWQGEKQGASKHWRERGRQYPDPGEGGPMPPEAHEALEKFAKIRTVLDKGGTLTEEQRARMHQDFAELADKLDEREARRKARGSHPAGSGDLPRAKGRELRPGGGRDGKPGSGGRDHLRSVP